MSVNRTHRLLCRRTVKIVDLPTLNPVRPRRVQTLYQRPVFGSIQGNDPDRAQQIPLVHLDGISVR